MAHPAAPCGTLGDSEFDRDTALTPRAGERGGYDAHLSGGWTVLGAVNGGYLLALAGRALREALPHPDPLTITAHYLTASQPGPATLRAETVRTGRSMSTGQLSLTQPDPARGGREAERLRVVAAYGDHAALTGEIRTTARPPAMPGWADCLGSEHAPGGVMPGDAAIVDRLDLRLDPATCGWAVGAPSGRGEMRGWLTLADGRPHDALSVLLAVDALPPTAFDLGLLGWTPTVELTVHLRCRPAPGPLLVSLTTRNLASGLLEEDGEVWDSAGRLVAQSRQLARAPR
jgi:hypothetical protein